MRILKILGTIAKAALAIAAVIFFHPDGLGSAAVAFAAVYAVVSWYIHSFANGTFVEGYGSGGIILALIINLCAPAMALVIPLFILDATLPSEIASIIYGIGVVIAGVWCLISDVMRVIDPDISVVDD